jgi:putative ABC transport system permease protein
MTFGGCGRSREDDADAEAILGGLAGTIVGAVATVIYAVSRRWSVQIPAVALYGDPGAALVIGAIAGLYPATRAARPAPTEAPRDMRAEPLVVPVISR